MSQSNEYNFFVLLMRIPIISSCIKNGTKVYYDIKGCNSYMKSTLGSLEQSVDNVKSSETMSKISQTITKPLMIADGLACNGLQMLQTKYPAISITPEDLKVEALKKMEDLRGYGTQKLGQAWELVGQHRGQVMEKFWHLIDIIIGSKVSFYVDLIDKKVDHYMPPDQSDSPMEVSDENMFARVSGLSSKIRNRVTQRYQRLVLKVMWAHN